MKLKAKAVKAVKAAKVVSDSIKLTAKTWKADVTQVLESTFFVHEKTLANVIENLVTTDAEKRTAVKTGTVLIRGNHGSVARDVEYSKDGAMRIRIYSAGGIMSGWFKESDVAIAGLTFEHYANAETLGKTFNVFQERKAAGSGESYRAAMENDLSKFVYSASVRKVNGKFIAWHEEDKRNDYNAHEVSATERELAKSAVIGSGKRTIKAKTRSKELVAA